MSEQLGAKKSFQHAVHCSVGANEIVAGTAHMIGKLLMGSFNSAAESVI